MTIANGTVHGRDLLFAVLTAYNATGQPGADGGSTSTGAGSPSPDKQHSGLAMYVAPHSVAISW